MRNINSLTHVRLRFALSTLYLVNDSTNLITTNIGALDTLFRFLPCQLNGILRYSSLNSTFPFQIQHIIAPNTGNITLSSNFKYQVLPPSINSCDTSNSQTFIALPALDNMAAPGDPVRIGDNIELRSTVAIQRSLGTDGILGTSVVACISSAYLTAITVEQSNI